MVVEFCSIFHLLTLITSNEKDNEEYKREIISILLEESNKIQKMYLISHDMRRENYRNMGVLQSEM